MGGTFSSVPDLREERPEGGHLSEAPIPMSPLNPAVGTDLPRASGAESTEDQQPHSAAVDPMAGISSQVRPTGAYWGMLSDASDIDFSYRYRIL